MVWSSINTINPLKLINKTIYIPQTFTLTYTYTGSDQTLTIPSNISSNVNIKCWGAGGGTVGKGAISTIYKTGLGGGGGYTEADFNKSFVAGQTLTIIVGQGGQTSNNGVNLLSTYGGGGGQPIAGDQNWGAASGGGRSAVRLPGSVEIITAGGGGAGGGTVANASAGVCSGGAGGGLSGANAEASDPLTGAPSPNNAPTVTQYNGYGGTQIAGGIKGDGLVATNNTNGIQFIGGSGTSYSPGGGGGYYGGGGGGATKTISGNNIWIWGGGGGGSSFVDTSKGTQIQMIQGDKATVAGTSFFPTGYSSANIGSGGVPDSTATTNSGKFGKPGLIVITYTI